MAICAMFDYVIFWVLRSVKLGFPPVFVAAKLDCVPTIQPQQVDSCLLLKKLVDLERRVDKHDELLRCPQLYPATKEDQTTSETEQLSASAAIGGSAEEGSRPPSRSRKPLRLAEDILRLASRLAAAYG